MENLRTGVRFPPPPPICGPACSKHGNRLFRLAFKIAAASLGEIIRMPGPNSREMPVMSFSKLGDLDKTIGTAGGAVPTRRTISRHLTRRRQIIFYGIPLKNQLTT